MKLKIPKQIYPAMKALVDSNNERKNENVYLLKPIIDKLIGAILKNCIRQSVFIINDVNPDSQTRYNENVLAIVVGNLIKEIISFSEEDCIRINSTENNEILISSKKNYVSMNSSFIVNVDSLQVIAQRLGAPVSISGSFKEGMEILVSFNKNAA